MRFLLSVPQAAAASGSAALWSTVSPPSAAESSDPRSPKEFFLRPSRLATCGTSGPPVLHRRSRPIQPDALARRVITLPVRWAPAAVRCTGPRAGPGPAAVACRDGPGPRARPASGESRSDRRRPLKRSQPGRAARPGRGRANLGHLFVLRCSRLRAYARRVRQHRLLGRQVTPTAYSPWCARRAAPRPPAAVDVQQAHPGAQPQLAAHQLVLGRCAASSPTEQVLQHPAHKYASEGPRSRPRSC